MIEDGFFMFGYVQRTVCVWCGRILCVYEEKEEEEGSFLCACKSLGVCLPFAAEGTNGHGNAWGPVQNATFIFKTKT